MGPGSTGAPDVSHGPPPEYNFYRERVGNSGYRVVYEISDDVMTVVAVLPKSDDTYDLAELSRRSSE